MVADTTRLTFTAKIAGVKAKIAGDYDSGNLELVLKVESPKNPRPPAIPWEWQDRSTGRVAWKKRPEDIQRKKGETDEEYEAREAVVQRKAQQQSYDFSKSRWEASFASYTSQCREHAGRVMSYAQLVGIAAVFGNQEMTVELTPANQDILPGFQANLLASPAEEASARGYYDGDPDGEDEDGEDDE